MRRETRPLQVSFWWARGGSNSRPYHPLNGDINGTRNETLAGLVLVGAGRLEVRPYHPLNGDNNETRNETLAGLVLVGAGRLELSTLPSPQRGQQ
jgi:hypothetical protein